MNSRLIARIILKLLFIGMLPLVSNYDWPPPKPIYIVDPTGRHVGTDPTRGNLSVKYQGHLFWTQIRTSNHCNPWSTRRSLSHKINRNQNWKLHFHCWINNPWKQNYWYLHW